ncbi:hypothetical protein NPIL_283721 [Nephila pilipes]|uniref:Uncharacterized protein n=1 Tax=Nephila pilipes TaxID=299642 RepID=A0A8X6U3C7_NEPPI|nr:hypothetical protein NPIL_283721 [Nephila pilipes]
MEEFSSIIAHLLMAYAKIYILVVTIELSLSVHALSSVSWTSLPTNMVFPQYTLEFPCTPRSVLSSASPVYTMPCHPNVPHLRSKQKIVAII